MKIEEVTKRLAQMPDDEYDAELFPIFLPNELNGQPKMDKELAFKALTVLYFVGIDVAAEDLLDKKGNMILTEDEFEKYIWRPCLETVIESYEGYYADPKDDLERNSIQKELFYTLKKFPKNLNEMSVDKIIQEYNPEKYLCEKFGYEDVSPENQSDEMTYRAYVGYNKEKEIPAFIKNRCNLTYSVLDTIIDLINENDIAPEDIIPEETYFWYSDVAQTLMNTYDIKPIKLDFTPPYRGTLLDFDEDYESVVKDYLEELEKCLQNDKFKEIFWKEYSSVNDGKNSELYNYFKGIKFDYFKNKELNNYPTLKEIVNQDINKECIGELDDILKSIPSMEKTERDENISNDEVGIK